MPQLFFKKNIKKVDYMHDSMYNDNACNFNWIKIENLKLNDLKLVVL